MASEMTMAGPRLGRGSFWRGDIAKAVVATLIVAAVAAAGGFGNLDGTADNDSLLRLVEVRDLIAGQGWFDLHQYRMGAGGGFLMHWSRLVDAPIAAIILAVAAITGSQAAGETAALIAWPLALYALALYLLLRIGRRLAGDEAMFPLLVIGGTTLYYTGIFAPGAIDHHNIQLVVMLAMVLFLLQSGPDNRRAAWRAGVAAVLMLAIGMETVPYVAVGGLFVTVWLLVRGDEASGVAAGFGVAFAATSVAVYAATVPPSEWGAAYCDAYSVTQFAIGVLAGAGLAVIASMRMLNRTFARRTGSLAVLGGAVAGLALVYFPQCLGDPYAELAPMLQSYWLDVVGEAQPLWRIMAKEPETAAGHYATVLIGLVVLALGMRRNGVRREEMFVAAMLTVALLVSIWQVRGSRFSVPLACVPLAIWVAGWRRKAQAEPGTASSLGLVGAWLVSFNVTWILAALGLWYLFSTAEDGEKLARETCYRQADYAQLGTLPAGNVLVISNLGAPVLRHTPHRVLAGPYHRNVEGNLAALDAFIGTPDKAEEIARANTIGIVAICRGNSETTFLAGRAPQGMLAGMLAGNTPGWMEIVPESKGKPLELYRVKPRS